MTLALFAGGARGLYGVLEHAVAPAVARTAPERSASSSRGPVTSLLRSQTQDGLPAAAGALVLAAYTLAMAVAGSKAARRRDVAWRTMKWV